VTNQIREARGTYARNARSARMTVEQQIILRDETLPVVLTAIHATRQASIASCGGMTVGGVKSSNDSRARPRCSPLFYAREFGWGGVSREGAIALLIAELHAAVIVCT
jgi:hypothetical protein